MKIITTDETLGGKAQQLNFNQGCHNNIIKDFIPIKMNQLNRKTECQ